METSNRTLPLSSMDLNSWVRMIQKAPVIFFDTETTGLSVYDGTDTILGFSIAFRTEAGMIAEYFPMYHDCGENLTEHEWRTLLDLIMQKVLVMHNSIFDITVLANIGYVVTKFYDTMKLDHLINENHMSYSLDNVTLRWLGYKGKERSPEFELGMIAYGWAGMPARIMHHYALTDAHILEPVFTKMLEVIEKHETRLINYWKKIEAPNLIGLTKMRQRGVRVVKELCAEQEAKGVEICKDIADNYFGFNPGSSKNLKMLLIDELGLPVIHKKRKRKDGSTISTPTFDKEAMKRYDLMLQRKAETESDDSLKEIAQKLFTYRGWTKAVTGYYRPYQNLVSNDGRIRPEYKPHGTVTGRYSCADPNLQQIPKETDKAWNGQVKECLTGDDGYILWEFDYSQLEFRLAAAASKEKKLLEIFNDVDRDIFTEMAAQLGMERQDTKGLTYSIQYGAGITRIMDIFGVTQQEAKEIIDNFYDQYPNLKNASQVMARNARNGSVQIWSGRKRHFRDPKNEYYKAFNSYVQGGAADVVKMVMNDALREIDNENECRLLLQVHDSLVWEIKKGREDYYRPLIEEVMTRPSERFGVQLAVDGHFWSHREETLYNAA